MTEKILSELNPANIPTEDEINAVISYFDMSNEKEGYDLYIKDLVEKHGEEWVERILASVIAAMSMPK